MLKELDIIAAKKIMLQQQLVDLQKQEDKILQKLRSGCMAWAKENGMLWVELTKQSRRQHHVDVRVAVCTFLRENTNLTFKEIGKFIGNAHHSTVMYHVSKEKTLKQKSLIQELSRYVAKL
jgi:chromosomal replication initiation ATPase DnaA